MFKNKFNGERLKSARLYRGLTISDLSKKINVSKQMVSKYENGKSSPGFEVLMLIVNSLNFPKEYFYEDDFKDPKIGNTYFRSLFSTSKKNQIIQIIRVKFLSQLHYFLEQYVEFPVLNLPDFDEEISNDVEKAAQRLREFWELGDEPIPNIVRLLEKKGFILASSATNSLSIDAFSQKQEIDGRDYYFIILGEDKGSAVRRQFDAAHELGHIVLHDPFLDLNDIDKEQFKEIEREANDFAAAFLLPKEAFAKDISVAPVDFDNYKHLKKKWKVSISAMTVRAYKIGVISYNQYHYLQRQISQNNWRRQEPLDELLKPGIPLAMKKAVELLIENEVMTGSELLTKLSRDHNLSLPREEVETLLNLPPGYLKTKKSKGASIVSIKNFKK